MSASGDDGSRVRRLFERAAAADSIAGVIFQGVSAVLLAVATALATGVLTLGDLFIIPLGGLAQATGGIIGGFFGGIGRLFRVGSIGSASQLAPGSPLAFFGFPLAAALVGLTAYIMVAVLSEQDTTNFLPFIGTGIDVPTPGLIDAEEEEEG
jgi:hypothetical protein